MLERGYLAEGASGRNGGGVRQQWSTEINIRLMQESVELCRRFAVDLGVNVWFRQGGYLFLARNAKEVARLEKNIDAAEPLRRRDADARAQPGRATSSPSSISTGIVGASYNPTDGILFPWPFLWGYARQAAALGVRIFTQTPVGGLAPLAGGGYVVHTAARRDPRAARDQRDRRVVTQARGADRRRGPDLADPPRDLLERAAQAVPAADGLRARERPVLQPVDARRDRRRRVRCPATAADLRDRARRSSSSRPTRAGSCG